MPVKSKATVFDKDYKQQPGMDNAQRDADSKTFAVPVEMLTSGKFMELGEMSGPQVGNAYDADALGEERAKITYERGGKGK